MRHLGAFKLLAFVLSVALGLSLAACSSAPPTTGNGSSIISSSSTSSATEEPTATAAGVTLSVGQSHYAPHDTIDVSIHNGLATSIFAKGSHSDCTIVTLLRSVSGSWQAQGSCVNMMPTPQLVEIRKGESTVEQLAPGQDDSSQLWPAGTYQVTFAFVSNPTQGFGQSAVVHSARFVVA
jgi:hypothetical protein